MFVAHINGTLVRPVVLGKSPDAVQIARRRIADILSMADEPYPESCTLNFMTALKVEGDVWSRKLVITSGSKTMSAVLTIRFTGAANPSEVQLTLDNGEVIYQNGALH